jgi:hypothetical protein
MSHLGNLPAGRREIIAERRVKAFELRKGGASYRQIGRALEVSEKTAHGDVMTRLRALARTEETVAADVRRLELERLDTLLVAHWAAATGGDERATRVALSILERRARLLGLDAPAKIDERVAGTTVMRVVWGDGDGTVE